ncbi:MAG: CPBP family intramembrane glutamic endopeptidase [Pseudomarimonas sp.]
MLENQKLRLGITLWLAAMAGVVVLSLTVIPQLLEKAPQSVPLEVAVAASVAQSGVLLALAVWGGVALSRPLGLGAPATEAALSGTGTWPALRRQLLPAAIAGVFVGGLLVLSARVAPAELLALGQTMEIPVAAKLLYGGVTEEVLMRWGLMTALLWLPWRLIQKRVGLPRTSYVVGAIVVAALLFGILHLPAAAAMGASLDPAVVAYVIAGNTVPGVLFGVLYWRYGLEAAIIAHALGHAVSVLAAV